MTGYICIAMLEDPPYNLIVAATANEPKDWCATLPLPSHLLCFKAFKNSDIIFKQFIQRLKANEVSVKTDKAFPAQPHEVIRVFNQVRDEAISGQQTIKEVIDVKNRERLHGLAKDMNKEMLVTPLYSAKNDVLKKLLGLLELIVLKEKVVAETEYQQVLTPKASTSSPSLAIQKRIGKFTVQDGIAEDTETGLMWLRFAHGQTWQNETVIGDVKGADWRQAFEIVKQFNQLGGYAGHSDWRLPTIDELKTLIDRVKGKSGNFIDMDVFPENAPWYWSSSPVARYNYDAWIVSFGNGDDYWGGKDLNGYAVRLVRSGQ